MWNIDLLSSEPWISLGTLTALEVVLGIDNVVFISILTEKLPREQRANAGRIGLGLALVTRVGLLFALTWAMGLTKPLFSVWRWHFSGRGLILLVGGLFLMGKAAHEIYDRLEGSHEDGARTRGGSLAIVLVQIVILDLVFSLDSVITAVGMARQLPIMVAAVVLAVVVMLVFAGTISSFITRHPSLRMLALSFLLLVGVLLVAEGMGQHIEKGYVYFAMAFALGVELLNLRGHRGREAPVKLKGRYET